MIEARDKIGREGFRLAEFRRKIEPKREKERVRIKERSETRNEKGKIENEGGESRRNGRREYNERSEKSRTRRKENEDAAAVELGGLERESRCLDGVAAGVEGV